MIQNPWQRNLMYYMHVREPTRIGNPTFMNIAICKAKQNRKQNEKLKLKNTLKLRVYDLYNLLHKLSGISRCLPLSLREGLCQRASNCPR